MKNYEATERAFKNGYEKGYEDGKRDAMKWIPSREKLPTRKDADKYGRVLVIEHGMIALANYCAPINYPDSFPFWLPLPEPPKEGE